MSLGLAKLLVAGITGIASLGVVSLFVYTEVTRSSQQTLWRRKLNLHSVGTIISCSDLSREQYRIEITSAGKDDKDLGLGLTLKLFKDGSRYWGGVQPQGGQNSVKTSRKGGWGFGKEWGTRSGNNRGVVIWDGESMRDDRQGVWSTNSCDSERKIERIASDSSGGPWKTTDVSTIRFETANCANNSLFSTTCDINFNKESDLKWISGYKPTVTFSVF